MNVRSCQCSSADAVAQRHSGTTGSLQNVQCTLGNTGQGGRAGAGGAGAGRVAAAAAALAALPQPLGGLGRLADAAEQAAAGPAPAPALFHLGRGRLRRQAGEDCGGRGRGARERRGARRRARRGGRGRLRRGRQEGQVALADAALLDGERLARYGDAGGWLSAELGQEDSPLLPCARQSQSSDMSMGWRSS